ncbi:MAG: septal ring lytic transglycosylase RlpA family protein [Alphaproteobacteria bacterium]|nr:septal ring lytic transglycosylase RlpA family protein [Alphaproteobacteria bacterium]
MPSFALKRVVPLLLVLALPACAETQFLLHTAKKLNGETPGGVYKIGDPYQIGGVWYYPAEDYNYDETGIASWYGSDFHGKATANGAVYDMNEVTAAHRTLPMPSLVRVTNLENGRSLIVKVNDRGPFARGRIIDLSRRSAQLLGFEGMGTARVRVTILADESREIAATMKAQGTVAEARVMPKPQGDMTDKTLTAKQMPKGDVAKEELAPPPGAVAAPKPVASRSITDVPLQSSSVQARPAAEAKIGTLTQDKAKATRIYVQAGAFRNFDNANKVSAKLTKVGPVSVSPTLSGGQDVFRVRLGPIASVEEADRFLDRVIRSGYPDARVVVD